MTKRAQLGMAMFLISETVFFFLLILAFVYFRGNGAVAVNLNFTAGAFDTACLLASGFTIWRASRDRSSARLWLLTTIVLGLLFVAGQGSEFLRLFREGVTIGGGLFGTAFFTLTGAHGLHVLAGLVALAIVPSTAIRTVALYWQFFAAVWLAIFLVAYVWSAA